MVVTLVQGQTIALPTGPGGQPAMRIEAGWTPGALPEMEIDPVAFLVGADGRAGRDEHIVFYNNPVSPCGGVALRDIGANGSRRPRFSLDLELAAVAPGVARILIGVAIHDAVRRGLSFGMLQRIGLVALDRAGASEVAVFEIDAYGRRESALVLAEVYRHKGAWKLRAVAQGYVDGLSRLVASVGITVDEAPPGPYDPPPPVLLPPPLIQI